MLLMIYLPSVMQDVIQNFKYMFIFILTISNALSVMFSILLNPFVINLCLYAY